MSEALIQVHGEYLSLTEAEARGLIELTEDGGYRVLTGDDDAPKRPDVGLLNGTVINNNNENS